MRAPGLCRICLCFLGFRFREILTLFICVSVGDIGAYLFAVANIFDELLTNAV